MEENPLFFFKGFCSRRLCTLTIAQYLPAGNDCLYTLIDAKRASVLDNEISHGGVERIIRDLG